jgi:hypothetical protein
LLAEAPLAGALPAFADEVGSVLASAFASVFVSADAAGFSEAPLPDEAPSDSWPTGAGVAALVAPRLSVL